MDKLETFIDNQAQKILYYCYKNEKSFPRNCGTVSTILAILLHSNKYVRDNYKIKYVRGHYKNMSEDDECCCKCRRSISRSSKFFNKECEFCTCDFMTVHSWLELTSVKTGKCFIVDCTSIQFNEDICDIESYMLNTRLTETKLFKYIKKNSKFIISKGSKSFNCHIPDVSIESAKSIYDITKSNYDAKKTTDVINTINKMILTSILEIKGL